MFGYAVCDDANRNSATPEARAELGKSQESATVHGITLVA
jgi:hypothetical protein